MQGLLAICGRHNIIVRDKQSLQVVAHIRVIFHQQHPGSFFIWLARSGRLSVWCNELTDIRKPSKSFLDVCLCMGRRGCKCGASTDALAWQMRRSKRYANHEGASALRRAFYRDLPAVQFRQFLYQCKTNPRAFVRATLGALHAVKPLEQAG